MQNTFWEPGHARPLPPPSWQLLFFSILPILILSLIKTFYWRMRLLYPVSYFPKLQHLSSITLRLIARVAHIIVQLNAVTFESWQLYQISWRIRGGGPTQQNVWISKAVNVLVCCATYQLWYSLVNADGNPSVWAVLFGRIMAILRCLMILSHFQVCKRQW